MPLYEYTPTGITEIPIATFAAERVRERSERQAKRTAIFLVVRHLCSKGRSPEAIAESAPWRKNRFWRSTDGEVDSAEFIRRVTAERRQSGHAFDPHRWYCGDGELIHAEGRTYAVSNQWGGRAMDVLDDLQKRFPDDGMVVSEVE